MANMLETAKRKVKAALYRTMKFVPAEMGDYFDKLDEDFVLPLRHNQNLIIAEHFDGIYIAEIKTKIDANRYNIEQFYGSQGEILEALKEEGIELHVCPICGKPWIADGYLSLDDDTVCRDCFPLYMDIKHPEGWKEIRGTVGGVSTCLVKNKMGYWHIHRFNFA